jgi:hypothetical protein
LPRPCAVEPGSDAPSSDAPSVWLAHRAARRFNAGAIRLVVIRDVALPFLAYRLLTGYGVPVVYALVIAALTPTLGVAYPWIHSRRLNTVALLSTGTLALAVLATYVTGDPRLILARGSVVTGALGVLCLVSVVRPFGVRPLAFYVVRQFRGGGDGAAELSLAWERRVAFRRGITLLTGIWGVLCITDATLRLALVYWLPIDVMLLLSPWITAAVAGLALATTIGFGRYMRRDQRSSG